MTISATLLSSKLKSLSDLAQIIDLEKQAGKVVVHAHGVFDLVHPGHLRHLSVARQHGDILVVTITADKHVNKGPDRPVFSEKLRAEFLSALELIDYVAINDNPTAVEAILELKPSIYIKGNDYQVAAEDITGGISKEAAAVNSVGGKIVFTDDITFSSSHLLNSHFDLLSTEAEEHLKAFRESYSVNSILSEIDKIESMKILIIGDVIIDEYVFCRVLGRSSKATSLNSQYISEEAHAGGILAIANHLAEFCKHPDLVTAFGTTNPYQTAYAQDSLPDTVSIHSFSLGDRPTTVKRRFIERFMTGKLFELSFVDNHDLPEPESKKIIQYLKKSIADFDLVLVADFGHGCIDSTVIEFLCSNAKYLAVNVQANSSNMGFNFISKYPRIDYLCIDKEELRLAYQDQFGPIEDLIRKAAKDFSTKLITITLGVNGSLVYDPKRDLFFKTPIFSQQVVDTTGAGDAFLAITSPLAANGASPELLGLVGNCVSALAVRVLGNRKPVEKVYLQKYIKALLA